MNKFLTHRFLRHSASVLLAVLLCCSTVSLPVQAQEESAELSVAAHSGLRFTAILPTAPPLPGPELTASQPDRQGRLQQAQTWPGSAAPSSIQLPAPAAQAAANAAPVAPQPTSAPRFLLHCSFLC